MKNYDDIINEPHPEPKKHRRMSRLSRAAQFGAFRALTGHEEAIAETARLTHNRVELDEYEIERLNEKLLIINDYIHTYPKVTITYFEKDEKKNGGAYIKYTGEVKKIDTYKRNIIMCDNTQISIDMILNLQSELFDVYGGH